LKIRCGRNGKIKITANDGGKMKSLKRGIIFYSAMCIILMKSNKFFIFLLILFCFFIISCGNQNNTLIDMFIDILESNTGYVYQDKNIYLNDMFADSGVYMYHIQVLEFSIIDMNDDGVPEVVLSISVPLEDKIVLHYENGVIYGYEFSVRGMNCLTKNGKFTSSSGAGNWSINKVRFSSGSYEIDELCRSESNADGNIYYVNNEEVSTDEFWLFMEEKTKESAEWYPFSADTIASDFATAWDSFIESQ
jgi:hypothetical protein